MKVKFVPLNKEVEIMPGQSVLNVAQDHGIHIQSVCKGIPSCAECRVQVVEGEENLLPPMDNELDLIGTAQFVDGSRLSCQMRCFGDVVVDLTEQMEKENESSKQPQGRASKKEGEESFARMGNILEEFSDSSDSSDESDESSSSKKIDKPLRNVDTKPSNNRSENAKNSREKGGSDPKKKSKNRRNRNNRRRNANKNASKD